MAYHLIKVIYNVTDCALPRGTRIISCKNSQESLSLPLHVVPWRVSYKKQELLTLREHLGLPPGFWGVSVVYLFSFLYWCFCFVCLRPVSCVPNVAGVQSWLSLRFSLTFNYTPYQKGLLIFNMFILCHKLIQIISVLSVCLAAYKFNCCNLQFLDNVIFIKTKVLLSQAEVTLSGTWYPIIRYLVSYYPVLGILLSGTWYPI